MGAIVYPGAAGRIDVNDDALAYIKTITIMKLRRNESFTITYTRLGEGRASIWIHPSISLQFHFDQSVTVELDRSRLENLMQDISTTGELRTSLVAHNR